MGVCTSTKMTNPKDRINHPTTKEEFPPEIKTERKTEEKLKKIKNERLAKSTIESKNIINQLALNNDVIISRNETNPDKIYIKKKIMGVGAFGEVWLVTHKELKKNFAMKLIKKRENKLSEEKEILNEISILKNLDHPKILKILDFFSTPKLYYIITEYCPKGELFNEIIKVGSFDEGKASFIMNQIFKAITYCHSQNIIHRDLKPENIMITEREKNGCLQVKIIDFGTAKISDKGEVENRYVGSSYYILLMVMMIMKY